MSKTAATLAQILLACVLVAVLAMATRTRTSTAGVAAKIAQVRKDQATIRTAIEAYRGENGTYPLDRYGFAKRFGRPRGYAGLNVLTTPVAYLHVLPNDAFPVRTPDGWEYFPFHYSAEGFKEWTRRIALVQAKGVDTGIAWVLVSRGPDDKYNFGEMVIWGQEVLNGITLDMEMTDLGNGAVYDATNGLVSPGDIICAGTAPGGARGASTIKP